MTRLTAQYPARMFVAVPGYGRVEVISVEGAGLWVRISVAGGPVERWVSAAVCKQVAP